MFESETPRGWSTVGKFIDYYVLSANAPAVWTVCTVRKQIETGRRRQLYARTSRL